MNGRAEIVHKTGKRDLPAAAAAADLFIGFMHDHAASGASQQNRRRQTVRAGTNDDIARLFK